MLSQERALVPEEPLPCPEPGCGGTLRRRESKHGLFYGCDRWFETKCKGSIGCNLDGSPHGIPADAETRNMRQVAHVFFDRLWTRWPMTRKEAYALVQERMGMREELHIANLHVPQLERLIDLVQTELKRRQGPTVPFHYVPTSLDELFTLRCGCGGVFGVSHGHTGSFMCPYCGKFGKLVPREDKEVFDEWP
jgi:ssDNA-binding Zn-finger/Zn-ribbon topoisomerase 1